MELIIAILLTEREILSNYGCMQLLPANGELTIETVCLPFRAVHVESPLVFRHRYQEVYINGRSLAGGDLLDAWGPGRKILAGPIRRAVVVL